MIRRDFYSHHHRIHENTLESTREEEEEEAGHGWQRRRGRLSARLVNNFLRLNASNAINSRFVLSSLYQLSECLQKRQEKQVALLLARKTFRWGGAVLSFRSLVASRSSQNKEKPAILDFWKPTAAPSLVKFFITSSFRLLFKFDFKVSISDGAVERSNMAAPREIKYFSNGTRCFIDETESVIRFSKLYRTRRCFYYFARQLHENAWLSLHFERRKERQKQLFKNK